MFILQMRRASKKLAQFPRSGNCSPGSYVIQRYVLYVERRCCDHGWWTDFSWM